ncbi:Thioredoxin-related protein [Salegentibacter holothuriorum]|uniref:Thioredoxin-related protein n=1 Tax=Salegentibacter holothuriorum TaxID=241145 RepID=A0A1T5BD82_9FLAO|nr:thioredoxin fold domain-containing protein [Salegentibacter holothuriorum]SKB45216.1 Thioredoxin-related protein [Salegentibacter holothuriorum]
MRKLTFFIFLIFIGVAVQAQEINWMSMNEALAAQEKEPKKIFMDAYTVWCGPCKMLDKNTFSHSDVIEFVNENYYPVKFNAEGNEEIDFKGQLFENPQYDPEKKKRRNSPHQLARALKITGYPSLVFFDEEANLIAPIAGYRTPKQLELYLKLFAEDEYKKMTSKEAFAVYQENFEGSFE